MNARKRNLAITGKEAYRSKSFRDTEVVFHRDHAAHDYLKRNWNLVETCLGMWAPKSFTRAHEKLRKLTPNRQFGQQFNNLVQNEVKLAVQEILKEPRFNKQVSNEQLIELMLGLGFYGSFSPNTEGMEKKEFKKMQSKIEAGIVMPHQVIIRPTSIQTLIPELEEKYSLKMSNLKIELSDPSSQYFTQKVSFDYGTYQAKVADKKTLKQKSFKALKYDFEMHTHAKPTFRVNISYELFGLPITYSADMLFPAATARSYEPTLTRVKVRGRLKIDYSDQYALGIQLENGKTIGCEHRAKLPDYLPAGALIEFEISPDSVWGHDVRSARLLETAARRIRFVSKNTSEASQVKSLQTDIVSQQINEAEQVLELEFSGPSEVGSIFMKFAGSGNKAVKRDFSVQLLSQGEWRLAMRASKSGLHPLILHRATAIRITFAKGQALTLEQLHLLKLHANDESVPSHW